MFKPFQIILGASVVLIKRKCCMKLFRGCLLIALLFEQLPENCVRSKGWSFFTEPVRKIATLQANS